jgi:hypothetical protein
VLDVAFVDEWASHVAERRPRARATDDLAGFGLGEALLRVYDMADGRATVADLLARVRSPDARTNFLRLLYLLAETDQIDLV